MKLPAVFDKLAQRKTLVAATATTALVAAAGADLAYNHARSEAALDAVGMQLRAGAAAGRTHDQIRSGSFNNLLTGSKGEYELLGTEWKAGDNRLCYWVGIVDGDYQVPQPVYTEIIRQKNAPEKVRLHKIAQVAAVCP